MRLVTTDDFIDAYAKLHQRGLGFILSKLKPNAEARTKSAFNESAIHAANWWIIPKVRERWNELMTGNPQQNYKQFLAQEFLKGQKGLKLLSLGSGTGSHELELAAYPNFSEILCIDLAPNLIQEAQKRAVQQNLQNIQFICANIDAYQLPEAHFDFVLFNSSLHHFQEVEKLLTNRIQDTLKASGKIIINEYVGPNRLQFPQEQLQAIEEALHLIPLAYRQRFKLTLHKNRFKGSGWIRMLLADPSECVDSQSIMPSLHRHFTPLIERPFGGNILMNVLKDIAHHFIQRKPETEVILDELFAFEDEYLQKHSSDFVFGIYQKK